MVVAWVKGLGLFCSRLNFANELTEHFSTANISLRGRFQTPSPSVPAKRFVSEYSKRWNPSVAGNPVFTAVQLVPLFVEDNYAALSPRKEIRSGYSKRIDRSVCWQPCIHGSPAGPVVGG